MKKIICDILHPHLPRLFRLQEPGLEKANS